MPFKSTNNFLNTIALASLMLAGCKVAVFGSIQEPQPLHVATCADPYDGIEEISISVEIERDADDASQSCGDSPSQSGNATSSPGQSNPTQSSYDDRPHPGQSKPPVVKKPVCQPMAPYRTVRNAAKIGKGKTLCSLTYTVSELESGDFAALNLGDEFLFLSDKNVTVSSATRKPFSETSLPVKFEAAPVCALTDKCAESGPWSVTSSSPDQLRPYAKYLADTESAVVTMVWSNAKPQKNKNLKATVILRYLSKEGD